MKKILKYLFGAAFIFLLAYNSVYVKKLSAVKSTTADRFDAVAFSDKLWEEQLPARLDSAIELSHLLALIKTNSREAFSTYSHALAIGNIRYFLVKAKGIVTRVDADDVMLQIQAGDSLVNLKLATEFIYGNAIRDASGLIDIEEFSATADLNAISEQLNRKIRTTLLPAFRAQVQQGDEVEVTGAIELNREHINTTELEIIPARLVIR